MPLTMRSNLAKPEIFHEMRPIYDMYEITRFRKRLVETVMAALVITLPLLGLPRDFRDFQKPPSVDMAESRDNGSETKIKAALEDYFRKASGLGFFGAVLMAKDGKVLFRNG